MTPLHQPWGWRGDEELPIARDQGLEKSVLMMKTSRASPRAHFQERQRSPFANMGFLGSGGSLQMFICMTIGGLGTRTCAWGAGHSRAVLEVALPGELVLP